MINERKLSKSELTKREDIIQALKKNKKQFVKRYGKDAEKVMYGVSTKQAKKKIEEMNKNRLRNMIEAALKNPKKADLNKDGKLSSYEKKRGAAIEKNIKESEKGSHFGVREAKEDVIDTITLDIPLFIRMLEYAREDAQEDVDLHDVAEKAIALNKEKGILSMEDYEALIPEPQTEKSLNEDLDIGHQDDEPHMLKADLYRIGKYAMELYQMVGKLEQDYREVDFPHWWQSKIIKSKDMLVSAKHYLDFETKEPEIDAMVGVIDKSGVLDNVGVNEYKSKK
jgi:hypothetical protein